MSRLYKNGTALYGINIDFLELDEAFLDAMPPARVRKILSYRFTGDRKRSYAAGLLLEAALGREAAFRVRQGASGKPFVDGGPHFSVSHSGDWAVIAVCDEPVGFDIEAVEPARDIAGVARRAFHPSEREEAARGGVDTFYRIWTAKESYMKMLGCGTAGMADFCVRLSGRNGGVEGRPDTAIRLFEHLPGYIAAVCSHAGMTWPEEIMAIKRFSV
jgi:4'-phosphopantetheinyl transferase